MYSFRTGVVQGLWTVDVVSSVVVVVILVLHVLCHTFTRVVQPVKECCTAFIRRCAIACWEVLYCLDYEVCYCLLGSVFACNITSCDLSLRSAFVTAYG